MQRSSMLALFLLAALPAQAQPALQGCIDDRRPASARVGSCTQALRLDLPPPARAAALRGRADARFSVILEQSEAPGAAVPPPAAFDAALADAEESVRITRRGETLSLIALIRLNRGDLSEAARRAAFARDNEGVVQALGAAIEQGPPRWEQYAARAMHRAWIGAAGVEDDYAAARRLLAGSP